MESYVTGYGIANSSSIALWDIEMQFFKTLVNGVNYATSSNGGSIVLINCSEMFLNYKHLIEMREKSDEIAHLKTREVSLIDKSYTLETSQIINIICYV